MGVWGKSGGILIILQTTDSLKSPIYSPFSGDGSDSRSGAGRSCYHSDGPRPNHGLFQGGRSRHRLRTAHRQAGAGNIPETP